MGRAWYEVRYREQVSPNKWVKKSKYYFARNPRDAAGKYKGKGYIMWVAKVAREKLMGVGEFFTLGNTLLKELRQGGETYAPLDVEIRRGHDKRRGYNERRREAAAS